MSDRHVAGSDFFSIRWFMKFNRTRWRRLLVGASGPYLLARALTASFGPSSVITRFIGTMHSDSVVLPRKSAVHARAELDVITRLTGHRKFPSIHGTLSVRDARSALCPRVGFRLGVRFTGRRRRGKFTPWFFGRQVEYTARTIACMRIALPQERLEPKSVVKARSDDYPANGIIASQTYPAGVKPKSNAAPRKRPESVHFRCVPRGSSSINQFFAE